MRNKFLLFLFAFGSFAAQAQHITLSGNAKKTHDHVINGLLSKQVKKQDALMKTTAGVLKQRIIAQSVRDNVLMTMADSVRVNYTSNSRGSEYDYNTMIYPYNYPYATSPMFDYAGTFTTPQVKFDTYVHWTINPFTMPMYQLYEGAYAEYDTMTNLIRYKQLFVDSVLNDNRTYANMFTSFNKIDTGMWFNFKLGVEDSAFKQIFAYDTLRRLVADTLYEMHLGVWRIAGLTSYSYDASGNLILIDHYANTEDTSFLLPLDHAAKYENTYDGSNRLITVLTSLFNGVTLSEYVKDTFAYSGSLPYHNSWRQHQFDVIHGTWWPQAGMVKHINASGLPDTVINQGWDSIAHSWVPWSMDVVSYNSYDNPDTMHNYEYNWSAYSLTPDYTTVYYYDTFTYVEPVNSVPRITGVDFSVFPNPSSNLLTVQLPDATALSAAATISVYNINGQVQTRQSFGRQSTQQLSVAGYAPGNYWIVIQDPATGIVGRKQFVKL